VGEYTTSYITNFDQDNAVIDPTGKFLLVVYSLDNDGVTWKIPVYIINPTTGLVTPSPLEPWSSTEHYGNQSSNINYTVK
jgi:hypothetical protein